MSKVNKQSLNPFFDKTKDINKKRRISVGINRKKEIKLNPNVFPPTLLIDFFKKN